MKRIVVLGPSNVNFVKSAGIVNYKDWINELTITTQEYFNEVVFMPDHGTYVDFAIQFQSNGGKITAIIPEEKAEYIKMAEKFNCNYEIFQNASGWSYLNTHLAGLADVVICLGYSAGSMLELCSIKYIQKYENRSINIFIDSRACSTNLPREIEEELRNVSYFENAKQLRKLYKGLAKKNE